jgi:uncharacterized protein YbjQ (UPF0145 family)
MPGKATNGELAPRTEARLKELVAWGGSTSFLTPRALSVAEDAGVHPVGQVVGLSAGVLLQGYVRTTHAGQGRLRFGVARWRERSGPLKSWTALRKRALHRLVKQAELLGADAVIGVQAAREVEATAEEISQAQVRFVGTAVRIDAWQRRTTPPVLTLASGQELWSMLRAGIEPAGIAGGFARVETLPSAATVVAALSARWRSANVELDDLTKAVYEARRLALERLVSDAGGLKADGLVGVRLELEGVDAPTATDVPTGWCVSARSRLPALKVTVHVLASAVRRVSSSSLQPERVLSVSDGARG